MAANTELQELPAPHTELVTYIAEHPEKPIAEIMEPYRKYEAQLRTVFAQDRQNPALSDPYINVLPLFTENTKDIKTRARNLAAESQEEKDCYIMPLPEDKRRAHDSPAVVKSLKEFQKNFSIFSESSLADLDWSNVVAAGSSVVNCLLPVPDEFNANKRKLREYYHEKFCPASDVDLFLYGLTHEEAIEKIMEIERAIRDAILTEVTVVRTKYAITIASQYPTRHVQIVLRVYKSIGEILTGFDIDAAGGAYNGSQVYVTPRALGSFITQINEIDLSRRSPSYENRLSKYSHRNFEVHWPDLDRSRVDPTIFERSFQRTLGLARLLILERLPTSSVRETYLNKRREERGRPAVVRYQFNSFGGNIKDMHEDEVADWVDESEVSNYHTFTVPYGQKFHAKKIEKLCYTKDLLLNAEWNQPKEREVYLHRHPAFFGRVQDVIEDCCGCCPKPVTPEEIEAAEKEGEIYISGKVSFLIDNPGRQQIGSFNPLTDDDWTDMAYVGNTARLCQSIVDGDVDDVLNWLSQEGSDPNKRDYTGRSPLHLAVMSSIPEIVKCLVDHGARLTARLADGKTALHLAAERGNAEIIKILMEKSIANEEEEEERQDRRRKATQSSGKEETPKPEAKAKEETESEEEDEEEEDSEEEDSDGELVDGEETEADSHSIATGSFVKVKKGEEDKEELVLEESTDEPDYYKIDVLAWDIPCSPLHLAIAEGHEECVKLLCDYGSDALLPVKFLDSEKQPTAAILTLALALSLPIEKAKSMAMLLLKLGAPSSQADLNGCTAFHRYVQKGNDQMMDTLWEHDKTGVKTAINHMIFTSSYWNAQAIAPLHTAIENGDTILVLKLLNAGANPQIDFDTWLKAAKFSSAEKRLGSYEDNMKMYNRSIEQPLIIAVRNATDPEIATKLLENGADPNTLTSQSQVLLVDEWQRRYNKGESVLDLVRNQLRGLRKYTGEKISMAKPKLPEGIDDCLKNYEEGTYQHWVVFKDVNLTLHNHKNSEQQYAKEEKKFSEMKGVVEKMNAIKDTIASLEQLEKSLVDRGGKTFEELYPDITTNENNNHSSVVDENKKSPAYSYNFTFSNVKDVTETRKAAYLELFEAAWAGDLDKIKSLTLQAWDKDKEEPPLKISANDRNDNTPFSLAFLRGHRDVAEAILEIVLAQYSPQDKEKAHYSLDTGGNEGNSEEDSEYESDEDSDDADPKIVSHIVDKKFTMDNIGQVSMQVKSHTKPLDVLLKSVPTFTLEDGKIKSNGNGLRSLFTYVLKHDDAVGLKALLDMAIHFSGKTLGSDEDESAGYFSFPEDCFRWAVQRGKTSLLTEIIKRTGAGMPLDHLVKKSGVEIKEKPRFYQGLSVYGKKRKDWANAGRNLVVKSTGLQIPPLLHAASEGNIESVEWFLGDAPQRYYVEFGNSKTAHEDVRLKHLNQAPGGFDRAVSKWLGIQNELVIHCAVMAPPGDASDRVVKYLIQACPVSLETKSTTGDTPLLLACFLGRVDFVKTLIQGGADQSVRNMRGDNIIHATLQGLPKVENPMDVKLSDMLDLFDPALRSHLFLQRNNLHEAGTTPLHSWISAIAFNYHSTYRGNTNYRYKNDEEILDTFKLLLEYSKGAELEMLNGAGDTCLHTCVMHDTTLLVKALLEYKPKLLHRENAVGRTPAELSRDRVTGEKFVAPSTIQISNRYNSANTLVGRSTESFLTKDAKTTALSKNQAVWEVCREYLERFPDQRRLVSLSEANDVARRLGEKYNSARYFSIQARNEDDDEEEGDETKNENKTDFASYMRQQKYSEAWQPRADALPVCKNCNGRH